MEVHYAPETIVELRRILYGCPYLMKVQVRDEIPPNTKTVADLRKLTDWSSDWSLAIPFGRDPWNVRRQNIWDNLRRDRKEDLAHLLSDVMRPGRDGEDVDSEWSVV